MLQRLLKHRFEQPVPVAEVPEPMVVAEPVVEEPEVVAEPGVVEPVVGEVTPAAEPAA